MPAGLAGRWCGRRHARRVDPSGFHAAVDCGTLAPCCTHPWEPRARPDVAGNGGGRVAGLPEDTSLTLGRPVAGSSVRGKARRPIDMAATPQRHPAMPQLHAGGIGISRPAGRHKTGNAVHHPKPVASPRADALHGTRGIISQSRRKFI
jgi:hypothetical protein